MGGTRLVDDIITSEFLKTIPVGADLLLIEDTETIPSTLKKCTIASLPATVLVEVNCKVTKSAVQSLAKDVPTIITWNTEDYDTNTMHNNVTDNSRITIKTAGKYLIVIQAEWGNNDQGNRILELLKNGTTVIGGTKYAADAESQHTLSGIHDFAVNDYVELRATQSSNGVLDFSNGVGIGETYVAAQKLN